MLPPHENGIDLRRIRSGRCAKLLLEKGYRVVGTSRDDQVANFANLDRLSITDHVELESMVLSDFRSTCRQLLRPNQTKCTA